MTNREHLLNVNERLCQKYNETDDDVVLEQIGLSEYFLFYSSDDWLNAEFQPTKETKR